MPRLATPAKEEGRREPPTDRDRFVLSLKLATLVVAIASVGVLLLLGGDGGDGRAADPAVPTIAGSAGTAGDGRAEPPASTTTAPSPTVIAPPARGSGTTEIVSAPKPVPKASTRLRPRPPGRFVVVGTPCRRPGAYALTADYEPVVCKRAARAHKRTWQPVF